MPAQPIETTFATSTMSHSAIRTVQQDRHDPHDVLEVAGDVGVLLLRANGEGAARRHLADGGDAIPGAAARLLGGALLGQQLRLELGGACGLGLGQAAGTGRDGRRRSRGRSRQCCASLDGPTLAGADTGRGRASPCRGSGPPVRTAATAARRRRRQRIHRLDAWRAASGGGVAGGAGASRWSGGWGPAARLGAASPGGPRDRSQHARGTVPRRRRRRAGGRVRAAGRRDRSCCSAGRPGWVDACRD